jgi:polysaccharide biosynthesis/export protein
MPSERDLQFPCAHPVPRKSVRRAAVLRALLPSLLASLLGLVNGVSASATTPIAAPPAAPDAAEHSLANLGAGDSVTVLVYGQPDMGTFYVGDDGTVDLPMVGHVSVKGLSPPQAAEQIAKALKAGQFFVDPHVSVTLVQSRSQRVSVFGEVRTPGLYTIEPDTTILDLLAQAGGTTENSGEVAYVLRGDGRREVNLKELASARGALANEVLHGGDKIVVPRYETFYILGEVASPNKYPLEPGMTVIQAIARAGGITARGSGRRLEIQRVGHGKGTSAGPNDLVQADDVIRVKERIF